MVQVQEMEKEPVLARELVLVPEWVLALVPAQRGQVPVQPGQDFL
jgi:hypothetical protein